MIEGSTIECHRSAANAAIIDNDALIAHLGAAGV